jgi:hypothetical protein
VASRISIVMVKPRGMDRHREARRGEAIQALERVDCFACGSQ